MSEIKGPDQDDGPSGAVESEAGPSHEGRVASFDDDAHSALGEDSLSEIDQIVDQWSHLGQESADERAHAEIERAHFLQEFQVITSSVMRPTMEMAIERLRKDGGGGLIEEHGLNVLHKPRVTLWMSMEGAIAGSPRQDLTPFCNSTPTWCIDGSMSGRVTWSRIRAPAVHHLHGRRPRSHRKRHGENR
jgi:hypothetical protein